MLNLQTNQFQEVLGEPSQDPGIARQYQPLWELYERTGAILSAVGTYAYGPRGHEGFLHLDLEEQLFFEYGFAAKFVKGQALPTLIN